MPQERLFSVDDCKIDKQGVMCDLCCSSTDCRGRACPTCYPARAAVRVRLGVAASICAIPKRVGQTLPLRYGASRTSISQKARLSLALPAMFLFATLGKHPALAQPSSEERQQSFTTSSLSDDPGTVFQGARKPTPLLGCFSAQDAVAAIFSGGQQLPLIPPEFQNPETTVTFRADSQQKIGDT